MTINQTHVTNRMDQLIESTYAQMIQLLSKPETSLDDVRDLARVMVDEARDSLEELRVADEEIRRQSEALEASQRMIEQERHRYRDLFISAPIGYVVTDCEGLILEANHAASQMLGVASAKLTGKPLAVFIPVEHRPEFREQLLLAAQGRSAKTWETLYVPRTGDTRSLELTVVTIEEGAGRERASLRWLLHDITDQKAAESNKLEHFFRETFDQSPVGIGHLGFNGGWLRVNQALCTMLGYSRDDLLTMRIQDSAYAEDAARFEEVHRQIIDGLLPIVGLEMRCLSKQGEIVWTRLGISSVSHVHGHHAYSIAILSDITESKRAAAAERKQRMLTEALRDTALTLTSTLDFEEVLDQIMTVIGGLFSRKAITIMLEENGNYNVARAWGYAEPVASELEQAVASITMPAAPAGILDHMTATQKPVIVNDWSDHGEWEDMPEIREIRSMIAVPVMTSGTVIGGLLLYSPLPDAFTVQEGELLETFAAHAAVAIQNARAHQQAQRLAAHEERQRLARDLHDAVTQSLFSASIISESLTRRQKDQSDPAAEQLLELHLLTRGALAEMRTLLMELRPEFLLKSPLATQIRQLGDAVRSRKRMAMNFTFQGGGVIPSNVQIAFYRISQEIFNNIVKHSQASHVNIALTAEPDAVSLEIEDDGIGFEPGNVTPGIGMATMHERADAIEASLSVESMTGKGTRVAVKWPINSVRS